MIEECPGNAAQRRKRLRFLPGLLLAVVILVLSMGWAYRGSLPTWGDEAFTLRIAQSSWADFNTEIKNDVHPPLYFWLARLCSDIFGPGSVRVLSQLIFLALIWETIRLARRRIEPGTGIVLVVLLIVSSAHLHLFGPMMRYYALAAVGVTSSTLLLLPPSGDVPAFGGSPYVHRSVWYAVFLWIALASSYMTAIVIPAHFIYMLSMPRADRRRFLLSLLISIICLIPFLPLFMAQVQGFHGKGMPGIVPLVIWVIIRLLFIIYSFLIGEFVRPWDWWLTIPTLIAFLFLVLLAWRMHKAPTGKLLWGVLMISLPLGALALTWIGIGVEFCASRLFFLAPLFLILIALGTADESLGSRMRSLGVGAVAILIGVNMVSTRNFSTGIGFIQSTYIIPWTRIADDIAANSTGYTVLFHDDETIEYWLDNNPNPDTFSLYSVLNGDEDLIDRTPDTVMVLYSPKSFTDRDLMSWRNLQHIQRRSCIERERIEYVREDETGMRWKSMLLRRDIYEVKKTLIVYNAAVLEWEEPEITSSH